MEKPSSTEHLANHESKDFDERSQVNRPVRPRLTLRQMQLLNCLEESLRARHSSPTYRELLSMLGITSTRALREALGALERKGVLRVEKGRHRGITILVSSRDCELAPLKGVAKASLGDERCKREVGT